MAATPRAGAHTSSTLTPPAPSPLGAAPSNPAASTSAASTPYAAFRDAARRQLRALALALRQRRDTGDPATPDQLRDTVDTALAHLGAVKRADKDKDARQQWEADARQVTLDRALEELVDEAVRLSRTPPACPVFMAILAARLQAVYPTDEAAFAHLQDVLDIVLCAYEAGYAEETLSLTILTNLMDVRPVTACEPLLGYIETRAPRLTKGMDYMRGRGPILLRLLNDLLRRLPRSQSEPVILSGRILLLLSSVYPLGEKSGVNLRGNFNVGKGTVWEQETKKDMDGAKEDARREDDDAKMTEVEEGEEAEPTHENGGGSSSGFYATFWSLQRYFNDPHLLFASPSTSSSGPLADLQDGVRQTLTAFAAATKQEKELSGAAKDGPATVAAEDVRGKARGNMDEGDDNGHEALEEYFFPKFLTSRNLLDLELADPAFRRQILVQLLILFQYLLSLTPASRERLAKLPVTNAPALTAHVLRPEAEAWVRELRSRTLDEMDAMDGGRRFRKAVMVVLTREQNWTDWKLRSCFGFIKPPLDADSQSDAARARQRALQRRPKRFPYALGNPRLDRLWRHNTTSLDGFETSAGADDLSSLLAPTGAYTQARLALQRARATASSSSSAAAGAGTGTGAVERAEAAHQAAQWRAVRAASGSALRFFARIGAGDVDVLRGLVEAERRETDGQGERDGEGEGEGDGAEKGDGDGEGQGYESDESVLRLRPRVKEAGTPEPQEGDRGAAGKKEEKKGEGSGAAPAEASHVDVKMDDADNAAGTPPPPPPPGPAAGTTVDDDEDDEPGTPPPKDATAALVKPGTPGTPGTPKRPRDGDDDEGGGAEVKMAEGAKTVAKRARID
ncbi:hypothetical protein JCM3770_007060 [Rhodotorula araucariae]